MHTECKLCARLCKGGQHAGPGLLKVLLSGSLSLITSQTFFSPLKAEAPYTPWIWAASKGKIGLKEGLVGGFSILFFSDPITSKFMEPLNREVKDEQD